RRRGEPIHPGTASVPPWSRSNATPVSPRTPVSTPDSPSSPMDRRPAPRPSRPAALVNRGRPRPAHRPTNQPTPQSRLAQDAVHRRRRGVIATVFIVLVAVLCAYLVFHFASSQYSASGLPGTSSVARTAVHNESSGVHTVSQNI
ncbi:MAG: serine/threonine protein kinase, partial [Cutibacterium avidum]|nr:serine/threonine protein kinase [Cutibacterium avidum]